MCWGSRKVDRDADDRIKARREHYCLSYLMVVGVDRIIVEGCVVLSGYGIVRATVAVFVAGNPPI